MNVFDKMLGFVAPKRALLNLQNRQRLNHFERNAANPGRLRGHSGGLQKNGSPENYKSNRDRIQLMWDARDLERNNALICGILDRVCQYVIGKLEYKSMTGDKEIDKIYQDYFHAWCKQADASGRFTFREMVEIALRSFLRDGDYGFAYHTETDGMNPRIYLQGVEADRIGSPLESINSETYIGGVMIDPDLGRPIGYRIFKRTRTNQYNFDKQVQPEHFIHLFRPVRNDEYRGRSWLAPALPHARDLHEIFGFEKQGAKFSAMWAAFVKTKEPYDQTAGAGWDTTETIEPDGKRRDKNGLGIYDALPGRVTRLDPNEDIIMADGVQRPSGAFINLVETVIHHIALGLNLPYGFVYKMSSFGGVTARLETQQAQRTIDRWQRMLEDKLLNRVRDQVLSIGILSKEIPAHPKFKNGAWRFGAHITADVQHQTSADIELIKMGLRTSTQWCAEHDVDLEQNFEEQAQEMLTLKDIASRTEVPIELINDSKPSATEMLASMEQRKQPQPPQPEGLIHSGVDLKPLLEIFEQVGDGSMEREAAIASIMKIYDIDYPTADMMVSVKSPPPVLDPNSPIAAQ